MKVYSRDIEYKKGDEFKIIAFSDVHHGAAACDEGDFVRMLQDHGRKPNTYFISVGDQLNCIWVKDKRFRVSENAPKYQNKEDFIDWQIEDFASMVQEHTDTKQWLGMGMGNHELELLLHSSSDPHRRLCNLLNITNLGYSFFLHVNFNMEDNHSHEAKRSIIIYGHHGWGGGSRTEGANLTKYAKNEAFYDADISLYGHTHDKFGKRMIRIISTQRGMKVFQKPMVVANCGCFLKTLSTDYLPTYSEKNGFPPRDIGYITIFVRLTDARYPDLRVME